MKKDATAFFPIWRDTRPILVKFTFLIDFLPSKSSSQIFNGLYITLVELKYHLRVNRDHNFREKNGCPSSRLPRPSGPG